MSPTSAYWTPASLSRRARFLTSSHVAGRVYSDTLGMSGHHGIDGPALAVLDHFFVAFIEKDALGRSRDVTSVRGHSCARFGARHRAGRWREAFTDDSLDRLLIRRNVGSGRFGWGVGHSSKSRRERAEDQAAWRELVAGRDSCGCGESRDSLSPCFYGAPNRIRTGVLALRGLCPGPLDDGSGVGSTRRSRAL